MQNLEMDLSWQRMQKEKYLYKTCLARAKVFTTSLPQPNIFHQVIGPILVVGSVPVRCVCFLMVSGFSIHIAFPLPPFVLRLVQVAKVLSAEDIWQAFASVAGVILIQEWPSNVSRVPWVPDDGVVDPIAVAWPDGLAFWGVHNSTQWTAIHEAATIDAVQTLHGCCRRCGCGCGCGSAVPSPPVELSSSCHHV